MQTTFATRLFLLPTLFLTAPVPAATLYSFTHIADVSSDDMPNTAINDAGQVVFNATLTSNHVNGVYVGTGGSLTPLATTADPRFTTFYGTDINAVGQVAFSGGSPATGNAVYTVNGSASPTLVAGKPAYTAVGGVPSINSSGAVTFEASKSGIDGLYQRAGDGSSLTTISSVPAGGVIGYGANTSTNDAGTTVYYASLTGGAKALRTSDGVTTTTVATTGPLFSQFDYASINDAGQVAFAATLASNHVNGIYVRQPDGTLTLVADSTSAYGTFNFASINDAGHLSFLSYLDAGGSGIFTGANPVSDLVIRSGNTLDGKTVADVWTSYHALNDAGSISFYASFTDGTAAVFRADVVPTPTSLAGGSLLCLFMALVPMGTKRGAQKGDGSHSVSQPFA